VNARDAMPEGGKLTIDAKNVELDDSFAQKHLGLLPGKYVRMRIADTGIGMDEAVMAHLFEPFFTTKEAGKWSGLGLSTVFGIVKQSEGYITVSSKPQMGTTFEIYFPQIEESEDLNATLQNLQPVATPGIQEPVLLVDDNEMVGRALSSLLEFHGYKVYRADGPGNAIDVFHENSGNILVLITDISMPGISGLQLAAQLRAIRPNLPVLYLSGYSDETALKGSELATGTAFLRKPVTKDALLEQLQKLLGDKR
jgi:CheY-like chemotaxis protein